MSNRLTHLVPALLILGLIGPVAAQEADMEIGFAIQPPVIDGEVDYAWEGASAQQIVAQDDPANASGSWKALYDSENLYLLVEITDDVLINDSANSWQDDSVEFYFDGGNTKDGPPLSGDNRQYTFGWTTDEVQGSNIRSEGVQLAQVDTDTGWRIEIKLPWLTLQDAMPQADDLIGIDCFYNDDDDGGDSREGQIFTFATDGSAWNDASQWGTAVLVAMPEPVAPGTEGLVAYYAFEDTADDSSDNGLHGTTAGDPNFVEGFAGYGVALDFDGIDDVVELGRFDVAGQITLAAWIKADDFEWNDARVISKAKEWGENDHWWMLSTISETSLRFRLKTDDGQGTSTLVSDPVLEAGVWAHVVAMWDGNTMRIYKDGAEVANREKGGAAVAVDPNVSVAIGSQPSDAFASDPSHVLKFFDGLIDEVQIYERALSAGEILYLAGVRPSVPVKNPSFELPGTDKQKGFDNVPGWSTDGPCADSGVETGFAPTDGDWTAYLMSGDPSVWQLTDYVLGEGSLLELRVDARITWAATTLQMTVYYDDNGARVPAATIDVPLADDMQEYTLLLSADDVPDAVGQQIGVEFANVSSGDTWIGLDRVRLLLLSEGGN